MHFVSSLIALLLGHFFARLYVPRASLPPHDPSYNPPTSLPSCPSPPTLHHRPRPSPCALVTDVTETSVTLALLQSQPPQLSPVDCPNQLTLPNATNIRLSNLHPDTTYLLSHPHCRQTFHTPPYNPSFESVADPPYTATRFRSRHDHNPRLWTSVYNGRAKRVCGVIATKNSFLAPRSGLCCLQLGGSGVLVDSQRVFHGVHMGVEGKSSRTLVEIWYQTADLEWQDEKESHGDSLALIVGWKSKEGVVDDGVIVRLEEGEGWRRNCVLIEGEVSMVHIFVHLHDVKNGSVFVDDVSVREIGLNESAGECSKVRVLAKVEEKKIDGKVHLQAKGGREGDVTVAVALTANRVLRLEALSRFWGGGIVAAVAVKDEREAQKFAKVWWKKKWLREFVNVSFVRKGEDGLAINALRNVAVEMVNSEFVMGLDVDMVPSVGGECIRDGEWLRKLLPPGEKRILTMPVFIVDVHCGVKGTKEEVLEQVNGRVGMVYCLNSQRGIRIKRWYAEEMGVETRFVTDFEPFGIWRRSDELQFDERFVGYGFNKVSWALQWQARGWRMYVLPRAIITHLNHVENNWVSAINVADYLVTWRRFLAFTAEVGA